MTSVVGGGWSEGAPSHGEKLVQARVRIVERLRARRGEIDEAIFARVSDRWFDRAGSEDPEYVAGLRAAGIAALDYVLVGIERSGESLQPVPAAVLEQARRAARVGVGVDTVLRRYHAGYAVLERFVIQEAERDEKDLIPRIGSRPPESVLGDVLQIVSALVDRLSAAVSKAYNKEIEQAGDAIERGGEATIASEDRLAPERQEASSDRAGSGASAGPGASRAALQGSQCERTSRRDLILSPRLRRSWPSTVWRARRCSWCSRGLGCHGARFTRSSLVWTSVWWRSWTGGWSARARRSWRGSRELGDELAGRILEQRRSQPPAAVEGPPAVDLTLIPAALRDPRAHRARLCLMYVAEQSVRGLSPSNKEIGEAIGVSHRGQLAKLLGRLAEQGLLVKRAGAPGHPNAWSATPAGERVALALADYR